LLPKPAQYLLRIDDLCPTLCRVAWQRLLPVIVESGIKPILAIVPANQDPELRRDEPDPDFWHEMRALEAAGATVALHGYRHLCRSKGRSLVPLHPQSEFAGVPEEQQRQWIEASLATLRARGLNPRIWVAPRHGFDRTTLRVLKRVGIGVLSDGFTRVPFARGGLAWIPQQLWSPVEKPAGLWTICVHPNSATAALANDLRAFMLEHAAQFTSIDRVLSEWEPATLSAAERIYEALALWKVQTRSALKRSRLRDRN